MNEIELKFQIPLTEQKRLYQWFLSKNARSVALYAKYYDTPERHLAQQHICLRQRLQGKTWIQTLKAPSQHQLKRFELEINLGELDNPALDLNIYHTHPKAQKILKHSLAKQAKNLTVHFETEVNRLVHLVQYKQAEIEISLDRGEIRQDLRSLAIYEIEFELKQGSVHQLIEFIQPWIKEYQLWLDVRTKAQRGDALTQDLDVSAVQFAMPLYLKQQDSSATAFKKMLNNALQHLLPNATALAAKQYNSEHIHQTRVAIRRLTTILRTFTEEAKAVDANWQAQLKTLFRQLSSTRDRDALTESLLPKLLAAGAPYVEFPQIAEPQAVVIEDIFRTVDTVNLILALLQFVHQPAEKSKKPIFKKQLSKKLQTLHRQICTDAAHFLELDDASRHRTRKRVKRLRYVVELVAALYTAKEVKQYLKALKVVQENLGEYNDLIVAETLFQSIVQRKQKVWFVLGWIANEKTYVLQHAQLHLAKLSKTKTFW